MKIAFGTFVVANNRAGTEAICAKSKTSFRYLNKIVPGCRLVVLISWKPSTELITLKGFSCIKSLLGFSLICTKRIFEQLNIMKSVQAYAYECVCYTRYTHSVAQIGAFLITLSWKETSLAKRQRHPDGYSSVISRMLSVRNKINL